MNWKRHATFSTKVKVSVSVLFNKENLINILVLDHGLGRFYIFVLQLLEDFIIPKCATFFFICEKFSNFGLLY